MYVSKSDVLLGKNISFQGHEEMLLRAIGSRGKSRDYRSYVDVLEICLFKPLSTGYRLIDIVRGIEHITTHLLRRNFIMNAFWILLQ